MHPGRAVSQELYTGRMAAGDLLPIPLTEIKATALDMAANSNTQREVAESLGIAPRTLARILAEDQGFRDTYDAALYQASSQLLEKLREVPWTEVDAQRARVKIEALSRYLELRWPHRYGKRLDVTVRAVDMRGALARARDRARPPAIEGVAVACGLDELLE